MGIHKSLVTSGKLARHRNVLKRDERIARLTEEEKWKEESNSVFGLQKVRNILHRAKKVKKAAVEGEGVEAVPGAAPVAGAAAAPGAKPAAGAAKGAAPAAAGKVPAAKGAAAPAAGKKPEAKK
ncbi:MAG: small basic protein [Candidatus Brocadiia bacterium]